MEWKDKLIDSDQFYIRTGHHNPKTMPVKSRIQIASEVRIGGLTLGEGLKKKFNDFVEVTSDERPERRDIKLHSGLYYHSADLWNPQVRSFRRKICYDTRDISIIANFTEFQNRSVILEYNFHTPVRARMSIQSLECNWTGASSRI